MTLFTYDLSENKVTITEDLRIEYRMLRHYAIYDTR